MANNKEVYLTEEGLNELKRELDELINVKRPANIQAIKEARSYGDLSENAEYDAARNEQAQIEARVKELERMLENVSIIKEIKTDSVGIGNVVSVKYVDEDDEDEYRIVGSQEADPFEGKISNESPIAQALLDHKVGDTVTVESPNGSYDLVITEIK
ncbi:MAG: transcription elongation factor GreA [Bacilli bacterium]|nr:transcription elongation factor GreA [Bacilli bacterium]